MAVVVPTPVEVPLYVVRRFRQDFFKVSRREFFPSPQRFVAKEDFKSYDNKLAASLSRAKSTILEYALCNDWEYFFTFTLDGEKWERYSIGEVLPQMMQWLANLRKTKYPRLRYLLVPELHRDGAWHFHGLICGIPISPLPPNAPIDLLEGGYWDWVDYRLKFGWCSLAPVRDPIRVSFYVTKYITKKLCGLADMKGFHTYYHSYGLARSRPVGCVYHTEIELNKYCTFGGEFYSFGFFHEHIENVVDLCDEVDDMYSVYVDSDLSTGEDFGMVVCFEPDSGDQLSFAQYLSECLRSEPVAPQGIQDPFPAIPAPGGVS